MAEKKSIKEQVTEYLKWLASFVSAIVICALGLQTFIKSTVNESVKTAFAEMIAPIQKEINNNERTISLLDYRMSQVESDIKVLRQNFEAILPNGYEAPKDPRKKFKPL